MNQDQQTFSRAVSVAVLGLVLQGAMALAMLLYAIFERHDADHAAFTAAGYAGFGLLAWGMTILLYDQHRRERLAILESEALESDMAHGASVFETSGDASLAATRRLNGMYKWFVPFVSLLIALGLIGFGLWRFQTGRELAAPGVIGESVLSGWALAAGLFCAFAGFVFARYVAGMAAKSVWANLRGGSSFAVGIALFGLAFTIGQFTDVAGTDAVRRLLPIILPVVVILLGAEIVLNFVAELYRPRRKGELPRPAIDSRLMGFFAAPDQAAKSVGELLDYQLGYSVQGSWFYRLFARWWAGLVLLVVGTVWALSMLAVLQPHERGIVLRFGEVVQEDIGPGLHFKLPWPIDQIVVPASIERDERGERIERTATGVRTAQLGSPSPDEGSGPILWTTIHAANEIFNITQPSRSVGNRGDDALALVAVEVPLKYAVEDPLLYEMLGPVGIRDRLLQAVGRRAVTRYLAHRSIDDLLGAGRAQLATELNAEISRAFSQLNPDASGQPQGAGVRILSVGVAGVHPPRQVAPKFEQVVIAQTNRETMIEDARRSEIESLAAVVGNVASARHIMALIDDYEGMRGRGATEEQLRDKEREITEAIGEAEGHAAELLAMARADRWIKHMTDRSALVNYEGQIHALRAAPNYFIARHYFDALGEIFNSSRIFIVPDRQAAEQLVTQIDLTESRTGAEIFDPNTFNPE